MAGYSGYGGSGGQNGYGGSSGYSIYGESSGQSGYCGPSGQGGYGGSSGHSRYGGSNGQTGYGGPSGPSGINGRSGQNGHNGHNGRSGHSGHNGYNGYGDDDWESHLYGESSRQKEQRQQPQRHRRRPRIVPSRQYEVYYSASDLENKIDSNDEGYDAYMNNEEENNDNNETEPIYESLQQGSAYDESYVKSHPVGIQRQEGIDLPDSPAKTSNQPRRILPETGQEIFARPRQMSPTLGNRVLPNTPVNKNTESAPVQNQPTRMNNTYTGNQPSADVAAPPHVQSEVNAVGQTQLMVVQPVVFSTQPGCMTGYLSSVFYLCHNAGCAGSACHRQC